MKHIVSFSIAALISILLLYVLAPELFNSDAYRDKKDRYDKLHRIDRSIIEHQQATIEKLEAKNKYLRERIAVKDTIIQKWERYYELCKEVHQ